MCGLPVGVYGSRLYGNSWRVCLPCCEKADSAGIDLTQMARDGEEQAAAAQAQSSVRTFSSMEDALAAADPRKDVIYHFGSRMVSEVDAPPEEVGLCPGEDLRECGPVGMRAQKHDGGKPQASLLWWPWVSGVVAVLGYGKQKYSAHQWGRGIAYSRLFDAAMRHLTAWWGGERNDPESGLPHLHHASCCLMMLDGMGSLQPSFDDRTAIWSESDSLPDAKQMATQDLADRVKEMDSAARSAIETLGPDPSPMVKQVVGELKAALKGKPYDA